MEIEVMVPKWISKRTAITFTFDLKTCFKVTAHHLLWYAVNVHVKSDRAKEKRIWSSKDFFLQKSDMTLKLLKKKITAEKFYVGTQPNQNFYIIKFILNANIILQCLFTFTENILRQTKTTKIT